MMNEVIHYWDEVGQPLCGADGLVAETGTCSRVFPLFINSFQDHTGHEPAGAVRRIAASIEKIDQMGLHCAPQVVAMALREYIKASGR